MTVYLEHLGKSADLTTRIGDGKEGEVYLCTEPGIAVKVLATDAPSWKWDQIEQMVAFPMPRDRFAWPLGLVRKLAGGKPVGFAMLYVKGMSLNTACFDKQVKLDGLTRIELSVSLADQFDYAHRQRIIFGDVSTYNVLVSTDSTDAIERPARVLAIDCDGWEVPGRDPVTGRPRRYGEPLGTPSFIAPELLKLTTLKGAPRTQHQDLFGLALLLFPLLVGTYAHEVCDPSGNHVTDLTEMIRAGRFPYAPVTPLPAGLVPKADPSCWAWLPPDVKQLFVRAFRDGHTDPAARPTAAEWRDALRRWHTAILAHAPTAGNALLQYLRGRLKRQALLKILDHAAAKCDFAPVWNWLRTGQRLPWVAMGVTATVIVGAALFRNPTLHPPPTDTPVQELENSSSVRPVPSTTRPRSAAERRAAEARWEGAPPVFREALREQLEGR